VQVGAAAVTTNAGAPAVAPSAASTAINLTITIAPPPAPRPAEDSLLGAFRELQQALGRSASGSTDDDEASIGAQLADFLRALADRLAQDAPAVTDLSTQPGALIDLRA
jgi:hypothetical protein